METHPPLLPDFLVRQPDGQILLAGHRVALQDVITPYVGGHSPEMLAAELPTLPLALIHKVIAFYLENERALQPYLEEELARVAQNRAAAPSDVSLGELRRRRIGNRAG
jgi:uncharacterized protein (DUF433 family)